MNSEKALASTLHVLIPAVSRFTQLTGICRHSVNHAKAVADLPQVSRVTLLVGSWQESYFRDALFTSNSKVEIASADCRNNSIARNTWYARVLPRLCSVQKADIVHLAYPVPLNRARFPVPVAATIHDLYPFDCPRNFGYPAVFFNRVFLRRCVHESDALVCVSDFTRSRLQQHFPHAAKRKRVVTVSSYSELSQIPDLSPPDAPERFILAIGQHRRNKNLDILIRAYADIVRSGSIAGDLRLVIAGALGPESPKLQSLVRALGLGEHAIFLHELTDANLRWLYRHCDIFVAASSIEGFCLPLLESSELASRIVCSDIPVFREVAPIDSIFFSLGAAPEKSLSRALIDALASAPRDSNERQTRFTRQRASCEYASFYSQLLRGDEFAPEQTDVAAVTDI